MAVRSRYSEAPEPSPSNQTLTMNRPLPLLLASIISLLLLHIYAKWFLLRAPRHRIRRCSALPSCLLQGFHLFQTFSIFHAAPAAACPMKGLEPSLIASIPIFLCKRNTASLCDDDDDSIRQDFGLECVISLSDFEEDDIGKALAKCGHAFHVASFPHHLPPLQSTRGLCSQRFTEDKR